MSIRKLFVAILFLSLYAFSVRVPLDPDMWWHLETGEYIIENGIPYQDPPFSFTMVDKEWITHEWLVDVMMFAIYDWVGLVGLALFFAMIVAISFALALLCECGAAVYRGAYDDVGDRILSSLFKLTAADV